MSIIINSKKIEIPNLVSTSWEDGNPKVKLITDKDPRQNRIRGIVCHTHEGRPGNLIPGTGPNTTIDERLAMYQVTTDRYVSWDWTIDMNGDVTWQNDPVKYVSWQAGSVNKRTVGFEFVQKIEGNKGHLYQTQVDKAVLVIDVVTALLGIQRQILWDKRKDKPYVGVISPCSSGEFVGIYGHRNITTNRGPGDPGDHIFYALKDAGYELFEINEDVTTWKTRQTALGIASDGLPLTDTVNALKNSGRPFGMWVPRPIDTFLATL